MSSVVETNFYQLTNRSGKLKINAKPVSSTDFIHSTRLALPLFRFLGIVGLQTANHSERIRAMNYKESRHVARASQFQ